MSARRRIALAGLALAVALVHLWGLEELARYQSAPGGSRSAGPIRMEVAFVQELAPTAVPPPAPAPAAAGSSPATGVAPSGSWMTTVVGSGVVRPTPTPEPEPPLDDEPEKQDQTTERLQDSAQKEPQALASASGPPDRAAESKPETPAEPTRPEATAPAPVLVVSAAPPAEAPAAPIVPPPLTPSPPVSPAATPTTAPSAAVPAASFPPLPSPAPPSPPPPVATAAPAEVPAPRPALTPSLPVQAPPPVPSVPGGVAPTVPAAPPPPLAPALSPRPMPAPATALQAGPNFEWPPSTRLSYILVGDYRGPVHGAASVEWLRSGSRYQVHLEVRVGPEMAPLMSRRMSSDGELTPQGLKPLRYDEVTRVLFANRQRTIRFEPDRVLLPGGGGVPVPPGVQDSASQFVQLTWLFNLQPHKLKAGEAVEIPLALPQRVSPWIYEVIGEERLQTPVGPLATWYLKPRRDSAGKSDLAVEVWIAPTLQYLPVRLRIRQEPDAMMDLTLSRLPQQAASAPVAGPAAARPGPTP